VLDFRPAPEASLRARTWRDGPELVYATATTEFAVSCLRIDGEHLGHEIDAAVRHEGPQILLCTGGVVLVHSKSSSLTIQRGAAAWVSADDAPIRLLAEQPAQLFRVSVGL
jgi:mannose-6-phosphate isomerase